MPKIIKVIFTSGRELVFTPRRTEHAKEIAKKILIQGVWNEDKDPYDYYPPHTIMKVEITEVKEEMRDAQKAK